MQLGMIGLGRMGSNMTKRLTEHGHDVMTYDPGVDSTASSLEELRDQLAAPRTFWMMVPAGEITEQTFRTLLEVGEQGDVIVDGGNSNFRDSQRRYRDAKSPAACARISFPNPNGCPGIASSSPVSSTTCRKRPVGGPPLCSCPVEWR